MSFIKISVTRPNLQEAGKFKQLFINSVPYDENVSFPYEKIISALRVLYPFKDIVISITLM